MTPWQGLSFTVQGWKDVRTFEIQSYNKFSTNSSGTCEIFAADLFCVDTLSVKCRTKVESAPHGRVKEAEHNSLPPINIDEEYWNNIMAQLSPSTQPDAFAAGQAGGERLGLCVCVCVCVCV